MNDANVRARSLRWGAVALLIVAAAYVAAQVYLTNSDRAPSWDEAIYLSQVTPHAPSLPFAPSRARGITWLVAPVTLAGGSVTAVRVYLMVASAIALWAAYLLWVRPVGAATAASGAAIFGLTWLALFYGSEVMPNLWSAFLVVAATGAFVRALGVRGRRWAMAAGGLVLLESLMRPPDGLVLVLALFAFVLVTRRRARATLVPLGAGLVLGWAVWLAEMSTRFGGPATALRQAGRLGHLTLSGIAERISQNLALTDGPTIGPDPHPHAPLAGLLWWGAIVVLAGVGVIRARADGVSGPVWCAAIVGSALAAEYLVFVAGLAPRFLMPAYATLSIPAASGLVSLVRGAGLRRVLGWGGVAVLVTLGVWQVGTARRIAADAAAFRTAFRVAGEAVRSASRGRPCFVGSDSGFPEMAYEAGCGGRELHGTDASAIADLVAAARGVRVYVVLRASPETDSPLRALAPTTVPTSEGGPWLLYALPHQPV